jgi:hypothetical protein
VGARELADGDDAGPGSRLTGSLSRVILAVAMLAALGALLFGAWHVVVGA